MTLRRFSEISADPGIRIGAFVLDETRTLTLMRLVPNRLPAGVALRTEMMDGREYLIAPVIAVREQVLNGILTLGDELTAVIDAGLTCLWFSTTHST